MSEKKSIRIDEGLSLEAVWSYLNYFESNQNNVRILRHRVDQNFFGLNHSAIISGKSSGSFDLQQVIDTNSDLNSIASEMQTVIKQAKEFFYASRHVTYLTSPLLLYYGFEQLGKVLILATYKFQNPRIGHGLTYNDTNIEVKLKSRGFFARLHDCYLPDMIYANELSFTLQDLLDSLPELGYYNRIRKDPSPFTIPSQAPEHRIFERQIDHPPSPINGEQLNKLDVYFLTMFILSNLVRYRPCQWTQMIGDDMAFTINEFLRLSEKVFPNLILDELTGVRHNFLPLAYYS